MSERRIVLGIDTATERTVVVLGSCGERFLATLGSAEVDAPRAAMSRVLVLVEDLLNENRLSLEDVDEVVVGRGPGSFTGVRIGVATAKGLAHGLGVPLYGVGTLDSIAWRFAGAEMLLGIVGDAMRGEVYPALFRCHNGIVERLSEDVVAVPAEAANAWSEHAGTIVLTGNGLGKHRDVFAEAIGADAILPAELWSPDGEGLLSAYVAQWILGERGSGDPGEVLPVYTRLSDAEENERQRKAMSSAPNSGASNSSALPSSGVAGEPS